MTVIKISIAWEDCSNFILSFKLLINMISVIINIKLKNDNQKLKVEENHEILNWFN